MVVERLLVHLDAEAGLRRRDVAAAADGDRVHEVLVQVLRVLQRAILEACTHHDVVDQRDVLPVLAEADAAGMRAHRHAKLGGEQQHGEHLVQPAESAGIHLQEVDRLRLQQLLEHHAVRAVLTRRDADRLHGAADRGVAQDVVGAGRLFDPEQLVWLQPRHVFDRLADVPRLVRVDHQRAVPADLFAHELAAVLVLGGVAAHLQLEARPAVGQRLPAQLADAVVGVPHPADRGDVRRIAVAEHLRLAGGARRHVAAQDVERFVRRQRVAQVAEVDAGDDLFRRHVGDELPHRLALDLRPEVPGGVDDGRRRKVDRALLRPDPPQLAVAGHLAPEPRHAGGDRLQRLADDQRRQRVRGGDADLVAAADRERHAVALDAVGAVRLQHHVGCGIVGVGVHRVGASLRAGRRHADVARMDAGDLRGHGRLLIYDAPG